MQSSFYRRPALMSRLALAAALVAASGVPWAAPGDLPVPPAAKASDSKKNMRTVSLPGHGLFVGDQLSEATRSRLVDLIVDALGLEVEVALMVPVGPWQLDGSGHTERDLTAARLQAVRKFLVDRGIEPKRIFVETRTDAKVSEPRLDVQLVGRPAVN